MIQRIRLNSDLSFFQKVKELDYILLISILILSFVSLAVMYSTDGGEILYHTKSHFSKLVIFFLLMIMIAFFNIKYWHAFAYFFYFCKFSRLTCNLPRHQNSIRNRRKNCAFGSFSCCSSI